MVKAAGFDAGFLSLAAIAAAGLLFYAALMPDAARTPAPAIAMMTRPLVLRVKVNSSNDGPARRARWQPNALAECAA